MGRGVTVAAPLEHPATSGLKAPDPKAGAVDGVLNTQRSEEQGTVAVQSAYERFAALVMTALDTLDKPHVISTPKTTDVQRKTTGSSMAP